MNTDHGKDWVSAWLVMAGLACAASGCGGGGGYGGGSGGSNGSGGIYSMTPAPAPTPSPSSTSMVFAATALVSDGAATPHTDADLVNGWGLAFNPVGFAWVADNGTSKSTLYDGNGVQQAPVVSIPAGTAGAASPTGIVYNGTGQFKITSGTTDTSLFIFAGEAGTISGWSPNVNNTAAVTVVDGGAAGKVYKGLAIGAYTNVNYIYATDFHNGAVDVFDGNFAPAALPGSFTDPSLPAGYAPYGIQNIGGMLFVSFAKQDAQAHDEVAGAGLGLIDEFDTGGNFIKRFATGGHLNAAWGMAKAPTDFGGFSNDILVSNFGDGTINAFNASTGAYAGTLSNSDGTPIVIDGLWGIAFGNGINNEPMNTLFYTAGPGNEAHGLFGRIDVQ